MLLSAATLAAFGVRVWRAEDNGGLDYDEVFTAALAALPPGEIIRYCLQATQEHPPLFYLVLHVWMALAGDSDIALRMAAIAPSTLAVPFIGLAAALTAGTPAGAIAAWVLALAPLDVFYGRYARMYGLLTLYIAVLLAAAAFVGKRRARAGTALAAGLVLLTMLTHYFLAFTVVVPALFVLLRRVGWRRAVIGAGLGAVLLVGGIAVSPGLRDTVGLRIGLRAIDPAVLGNAYVTSLGGIVWPFGSVVAGAIAVALAVVVVVWKRREYRGAGWPTALVALLTGTLGVASLTLIGVLVLPRYTVTAVPAAAMLIGLALGKSRKVVAVPLVVAVLSLVFWSAVKPIFDQRWSDYREAVAALRQQARPDDAVVVNGPAQIFWYQRYGPDLPQAAVLVRAEGDLPSQRLSAVVEARPVQSAFADEVLSRQAAGHPRLWVVESAMSYFDPEGVVLRWLDARAYPVSVLRFNNALLRLYLTDGDRPGNLDLRQVDRTLLDVRIDRIGLDRWTIPAGNDSRLAILGHPDGGTGARKLSVRLVGGGKTIWEQDAPLAADRGQLSMRAGLVIPADANPGTYQLQLVVYEANSQGIVRSSDPVAVSEVTITVADTA